MRKRNNLNNVSKINRLYEYKTTGIPIYTLNSDIVTTLRT